MWIVIHILQNLLIGNVLTITSKALRSDRKKLVTQGLSNIYEPNLNTSKMKGNAELLCLKTFNDLYVGPSTQCNMGNEKGVFVWRNFFNAYLKEIQQINEFMIFSRECA